MVHMMLMWCEPYLSTIDFRIAILISTEDQARNHVASRLSPYIRRLPRLPSDEEVAQYISSHIEQPIEFKHLSSEQERFVLMNLITTIFAYRGLVSSLSKAFHVVISRQPGMGKSLRVKRMVEMIERVNVSGKPSYVNIPIHGPDVSVRHILELMEQCRQDPTEPYPQLIHFNIAQNVSYILSLSIFVYIFVLILDD